MKSPSHHSINSEYSPVKTIVKTTEACTRFYLNFVGRSLCRSKIDKMPRRSIYKVAGGKAMAKDNVFSKAQDYVYETSS